LKNNIEDIRFEIWMSCKIVYQASNSITFWIIV
jgi:hypothetical protein